MVDHPELTPAAESATSSATLQHHSVMHDASQSTMARPKLWKWTDPGTSYHLASTWPPAPNIPLAARVYHAGATNKPHAPGLDPGVVNVKPYICEYLDKGFPNMLRLRKHMTIHTLPTSFVCAICLIGFKKKALDIHVSSHG
ncbi:hypothetical protein HPB50_013365 [Hyalomma asiaticum]|uniref:Uncharacterized protein n=1 Tax=Hyalomma asiaticum TaxID=266040 RepID=A0ACB7RIZ0_HYAAI|nr:hypothetical protein HPB50_013365 [Hyalomma asiaticum]